MSRLQELKSKRLKRRRLLGKLRILIFVLLGALFAAMLAFTVILCVGKLNSGKTSSSGEKDENASGEVLLSNEDIAGTEKNIVYVPVYPEDTDSSSFYDNVSQKTAYEDVLDYLYGNFTDPGVISCDGDFANIRRGPSTDSQIIGKAKRYSAFEILDETEDGWYLITAEGHQGYISSANVRRGEEAENIVKNNISRVAYPLSSFQKTYVTADEASDEAFLIYSEIPYTVTGEEEDYYIVIDYLGESGYIKKENVSVRYALSYPYFFEEDEALSDLRLEVLDYAFNWYGGAYVWGGATLGVGVDCSSYCMRVFQHFGIEIPRLSAEQALWGKEVSSIEEARAGDLVFFRGYYDNGTISEGVGHVGMYIGNGKMIHAASKERGIVVDTYNYYEPLICIRRMIND